MLFALLVVLVLWWWLPFLNLAWFSRRVDALRGCRCRFGSVVCFGEGWLPVLGVWVAWVALGIVLGMLQSVWALMGSNYLSLLFVLLYLLLETWKSFVSWGS